MGLWPFGTLLIHVVSHCSPSPYNGSMTGSSSNLHYAASISNNNNNNNNNNGYNTPATTQDDNHHDYMNADAVHYTSNYSHDGYVVDASQQLYANYPPRSLANGHHSNNNDNNGLQHEHYAHHQQVSNATSLPLSSSSPQPPHHHHNRHSSSSSSPSGGVESSVPQGSPQGESGYGKIVSSNDSFDFEYKL